MDNPEHADRSNDTAALNKAKIEKAKAAGQQVVTATADTLIQEGDSCTTDQGRSGYMISCGRDQFICVPNDEV